MRLEIYKQIKRQNPVTKKKIINSAVMINRSKTPITRINQMMTVMLEVKKGVVCLMKIRDTDKWNMK